MSRWIDLSHPFYEGMPKGGALGPAQLRCHEAQIPGVSLPDGYRVRVTEFAVPVHVGTHVDAPCHFVEGGASIGDLPLDQFGGPGVIVDLHKEPCEPITVEDLERASPRVRRGDIVFLRTGWGTKFKPDSLAAYLRQPYLLPAVADWLVEAGVKMLGTDTVSPDSPWEVRPPGYRMDVHCRLLGSGVLIMENLNLETVKPAGLLGRRCTILAFPLNIADSDGAPARVVAVPE